MRAQEKRPRSKASGSPKVLFRISLDCGKRATKEAFVERLFVITISDSRRALTCPVRQRGRVVSDRKRCPNKCRKERGDFSESPEVLFSSHCSLVSKDSFSRSALSSHRTPSPFSAFLCRTESRKKASALCCTRPPGRICIVFLFFGFLCFKS